MREIKKYQCQICGRMFQEKGACEMHEKRHIMAYDLYYSTPSRFPLDVPGARKYMLYPYKVAVRLSDGSEGQYELTSVRTVKREEYESHGKD